MEINQYKEQICFIAPIVAGVIASLELQETTYFWIGMASSINMLPYIEALKNYKE